MSDRAERKYNQEERDLLMDAAATVLLATVAADRSGPVEYFAEMTAAGTFLYEARGRYRDNALVQELYGRQEENGTAPEPESVTQETLLSNIDRVSGLLRRDREGIEFRRFLLELAERVAKASRTGWFGPRVSAEEEKFLADLRHRLGLPEQ
ncbi:MAG: hypothetical protein WD314_06725 [Trueperaceae bacterium]